MEGVMGRRWRKGGSQGEGKGAARETGLASKGEERRRQFAKGKEGDSGRSLWGGREGGGTGRRGRGEDGKGRV